MLSMYQFGALVIYRGEGVCRVEAVGPLNMPDVQKDKLYYTLVPLYVGEKIYTPVDTSAIIRPTLTKEEAVELVRTIPNIQAISCTGRDPRTLNAFYSEKLCSYDCINMVQVIKTAYNKRSTCRSQGSKPSSVDERYMKRAEELLYGELAVALEIPREDVLGYISQVIENAS